MQTVNFYFGDKAWPYRLPQANSVRAQQLSEIKGEPLQKEGNSPENLNCRTALQLE